MTIESVIAGDLDEISSLRPEGWPDIRPWFEFYLSSSACHSFKVVEGGHILGTGTVIVFGASAWFAHVIVREECRGRGLGSLMVSHLLSYCSSSAISTVSLIATEMGFPVYKKAGFRTVSEYRIFTRRETLALPGDLPVSRFDGQFRGGLLALDFRAAGEDRSSVLERYLSDAYICAAGNTCRGFYLPSLGEGLIIADDEEAGLALMKLKYSSQCRAALPSENISGMRFLEQNGFELSGQGTRMICGQDVGWKPKMIYSRIAGNMG